MKKSWFTNEPFNEEVSNGMYYYSDSLYLKQIILDMFEEGNELLNRALFKCYLQQTDSRQNC